MVLKVYFETWDGSSNGENIVFIFLKNQKLGWEMLRNPKKSQNRLKSSKKTQKCVVSGQIPLITTIIFCVKKLQKIKNKISFKAILL